MDGVPPRGLPQPRGGSLAAAGYFAALAVVAPLLFVLGGASMFVGIALTLGAGLSLLLRYEWRRVGHPLTPAGIVALGGILLFVLRPLTIDSSGTTTPGAILDTRYFTGGTVQAATEALLQVTVFYLAFGVIYFLIMSTRCAARGADVPDVAVRRAGFVLALATAFAVLCAAVLIQSSGGIAEHFAGVSIRSSFLAGRYFLTLGYVPLTIALVLYVLTRRFRGLPDWNGLAIIAAGILCVVGFTTGGRGPLVLGIILPLLILQQTGPRRFSTRALILIGISLLAGAMVMSLFLRENQYDQGASLAALQDDPFGTLLNRLTSGVETRPFDSLILLNEADNAGRMPPLFGLTYLAVPTWFIPGEILPGKMGGANTWFTMTYVPRFYYPERIETSISAIGEGYANFGYFGIVLVGVLVAVAAAKLTMHRERTTLQRTLFAVILTPMFFSFIRGDAYQNLSAVMLMALIAAAMLAIVVPRQPSGSLNFGSFLTSLQKR